LHIVICFGKITVNLKNFNMEINMKKIKIKNQGMMRLSPVVVLLLLSFLTILSCKDNDMLEADHTTYYPPKAELKSSLVSFYPDSGGFATKLIIKGTNLGTDTNYVKVTVNDRKARIVAVNNDILYAVVPTRAGTGPVRLYVKRTKDFEEFTSTTDFKYLYKSNVSTLFGIPGKMSPDNRLDGPYDVALLRRPWQIVVDNDGVIYFIDEGRGQNKNGALRKAANGNVETLVYDNAGVFQSPNCVVFNANQDTLFMANRFDVNATDVKTDVNVMYATRETNFVNVKALTSFHMAGTNSIAINPKTSELFFDNNSEGAIYKYTGEGKYIKVLTVRPGFNDMEMRLLFNKTGDILYIVARKKHCIYKVSYDITTHTFGEVVPFAGEYGQSGYASGTGTAARFNGPSSPCFDSDGNLLVPDKFNHCIRKITLEGEVTLYAGQPGVSGCVDGVPERAKFNCPEAVTYHGNSLIVADRENEVVRSVVIE
jgi:hypothetical protein